MKKIIAIMMALIMMMAIAVPAFAAPPLTQAEKSGTAIVLTDISAVQGDGTYSVSYPATMPLVWNTQKTDFHYSVTSQLKAGKCVEVSVADQDDAYLMVSASNQTLAYELQGTTTGKTLAPVVTDVTFDYSIYVDPANWAAAPIDEYQDTLTFTSAVVAL